MAEENAPETTPEPEPGTTWPDYAIYITERIFISILDKLNLGYLVLLLTFMGLLVLTILQLSSEDLRVLIEEFGQAVFGPSLRNLVVYILLFTIFLMLWLARADRKKDRKEIKRLAAFRDAFLSRKIEIVEVAHKYLSKNPSASLQATIEAVEKSLGERLIDTTKVSSKFKLE